MGFTTSIPEPELERGDGPDPVEGVDIEASRGKSNEPKHHMSESEIEMPKGDELVTRTTSIEGVEKAPAKKSTAKTKAK